MEKLASYLEQTGQTQGEFAERIGVDQSVVNKYLKRKARPTLERMVLIDQVTGGAVPVSSWVQQ